MSSAPSFTIVDTYGNTLRFDRFAYEFPLRVLRGEWWDANWVCCRITLEARIESAHANATLKQSVDAQLLTTDIKELSETLEEALSITATEKTFEPLEPYIVLNITRSEEYVRIEARLDLAPAVGPVIEFLLKCRPEDIAVTVREIGRVQEAFPERIV